eukprot:TRINITY_DN734_c0_g1_i1.p1 TRINITY_DN734_c0_g1~~TRINITY_DN734_c0_g1_i1.p1  ORF type:complete len:396 (-),score=66.66 TRINITY_DN734_c0_g1_i1:203-1390(-)
MRSQVSRSRCRPLLSLAATGAFALLHRRRPTGPQPTSGLLNCLLSPVAGRAYMGVDVLVKPDTSVAAKVGVAAATPHPARHTALAINGKRAENFISKEDLLDKHVGAYTTARTVDKTNVFELTMHCTRLYDTATAILERPVEAYADKARRTAALEFLRTVGPQGLKPLVTREISAVLSLAEDELGDSGPNGADDKEYQITMVVTWDSVGDHTPEGRGLDFFTFAQPMPSTASMVDVHAYKAERSCPTVKDVQWTKDRKGLEKLQKEARVNEVIMYGPTGSVTEGLQTNFFAVTPDGTLLTAADEHVLSGTVRKVVLEVAEKESIPVRFECPDINKMSEWDSCFICSTSRLVKPIHTLSAPDLGLKRDFPAEASVTHKLEELVRDSMLANSEPVVV